MSNDLIQTRNTRTGDARKIDEWFVVLPGGKKARFDVTMKYEHGLCLFGLKSDHPDFSDMKLADSDLNELKSLLDVHVKRVIEDRLSEGWVPASIVEISHKATEARRAYDDVTFRLTLRMRRVEHLDRKAPGNFPVVTVRDDYRQEDLALRAHADDFSAQRPKSGSLVDPEVQAWISHPLSRDGETGFGRCVVHGDGSAEEVFLRSLERFADHLADRLSPGRVEVQGFPAPVELIEMARLAVKADGS